MPFWPFRKKADPLAEMLTALNTQIDGDFSMFACGKDAPSESVLQIFEKSTGFRLPDDFRRFSMSSVGGLYIDAKESVWPRAKKFEVAPFWSFLSGLYVYGFGKDIPESMNFRIATETFRAESNTNCVPCLRVLSNADIFCFDQDGRLRQWDHETGEVPLQQLNFTELFIREVTELRQRKDRKIAERKMPPPLP